MLWYIYFMELFMFRLVNFFGLFKMNWFDLIEFYILMIFLKVIKLECVYIFKYLGNDLVFFFKKIILFYSNF